MTAPGEVYACSCAADAASVPASVREGARTRHRRRSSQRVYRRRNARTKRSTANHAATPSDATVINRLKSSSSFLAGSRQR